MYSTMKTVQSIMFGALLFVTSTWAEPAWDIVPTAVPNEGYRVTLTAPSCDKEGVGEGFALRAPGAAAPGEPGTPDLPVFATLLPGRVGQELHVTAIRFGTATETAISIAPVSGTVDLAIYEQNAYWPDSPARMTHASMGATRWVRLAVCPFGYNPVTEKLRLYESVEVTLAFAPERAERGGSGGGLTSLGGSDACVPCQTEFSSVVPDMSAGTPGLFASRRAGAGVDARWKLTLTNQGLHRLTFEELTAAGVPASDLNGDSLCLYMLERELPLIVSTAGAFGPGDYLLFYALAFRGDYSNENVAWLGFESGGARMAERGASPLSGAALVTSACTRVSFDTKTVYDPAYRPIDPSFDHWFAYRIEGDTQSNVVMTTDHVDASVDCSLEVRLHGLESWGSVNPDHRSQIRINGSTVTNEYYDGQVSVISTMTLPASILTSDTTEVQVRQRVVSGVPHANFAAAYLESVSLTYTRSLFAREGQLTFGGAASSNNYVVQDLGSNTLYQVLEVSDPWSPVRLTGFQVSTNAAGPLVVFGDEAPLARCYHVAGDSGFQAVTSIERVRFRNLADSARHADFVVVCPYAFRPSVYNLLKHRKKSGLDVVVAPLEDIYNEFGYGLRDAAVIKQFLGYAYHHWAGSPSYVVLAGRGSYDPMNRLGHGEADIVPVRMYPTPYRQTSIDQWYVTVDGNDFLADMSLGRIPASSDEQLRHAVDKTVAFEGSAGTESWRGKMLLVADNDDGIDFKGASESYIKTNLVAGGYDPLFGIRSAYLDDVGSAALINTQISDFIDGGGALVTFFGHGSVGQWMGENAWNTNDVAALSNTVFPLVTVFTCQNGNFQEPASDCLGEVFVEAQARGAVACVAPTALSLQIASQKLAQGFFAAYGADREPRLADAMNRAFLNLWTFNPNLTELLHYEILGDPALLVHPPDEP